MADDVLKSGPSRIESLLTFVNQTERTVKVIWINYDGKHYPYKKLEPLQTYKINTYVGHPWIFLDTHSGDRMMVESKDVFFPPPFSSNNQQRRKYIYITLPGIL